MKGKPLNAACQPIARYRALRKLSRRRPTTAELDRQHVGLAIQQAAAENA